MNLYLSLRRVGSVPIVSLRSWKGEVSMILGRTRLFSRLHKDLGLCSILGFLQAQAIGS